MKRRLKKKRMNHDQESKLNPELDELLSQLQASSDFVQFSYGMEPDRFLISYIKSMVKEEMIPGIFFLTFRTVWSPLKISSFWFPLKI